MRLALKPRGSHAAVEYQPGSRLSKAQLTQGDHAPRVRFPPTSLISDDQTWFSLFVQEAPLSSPSPSPVQAWQSMEACSSWPLATGNHVQQLWPSGPRNCQGLDASVQSAQLENTEDLKPFMACDAWTGVVGGHLGAHPIRMGRFTAACSHTSLWDRERFTLIFCKEMDDWQCFRQETRAMLFSCASMNMNVMNQYISGTWSHAIWHDISVH